MFVDIFKLLIIFNPLQLQKRLGELTHNHFGLVSIAINPIFCFLIGWLACGRFHKSCWDLTAYWVEKVTEKNTGKSQGVNKGFKMLQY